MRYAGFWRRLTAYGIDGTIVQVMFMVAFWLLGDAANAQEISSETVDTLVQMGWLPAPQPGQSVTDVLNASGANIGFGGPSMSDIFIFLLISGIYNIWFTASAWQATPGKRWCKLRVIRSDGAAITLGRSALRWFASGVSWLPFGLGYFMVGFSPEKMAMHDAICGTRVVYRDNA